MQQVTLDIEHKLSETDYLNFLSDLTFSNGLSLALWRLPNDTEKHLIISGHQSSLARDKGLEDLPEGFMFAPFEREQPAHYLPADFTFSFSNGNLKSPVTPRGESSLAWLKEFYQQKSDFPKRTFSPLAPNDSEIIDKDTFLEMIQQRIAAIKKDVFEKVVPSRQLRVGLKEDFDVIEAFLNLCDANPIALISWVSIPGIGDWMGATPELLVSVHDHTTLQAVAWTQKEIEEQGDGE